MATTAVAIGKIELQVRKEQPIPDGWAVGKNGMVTNDAKEAFDAGLLLPLGGLEVTSGYKGKCTIFGVQLFDMAGSRLNCLYSLHISNECVHISLLHLLCVFHFFPVIFRFFFFFFNRLWFGCDG